MKMHTASPVESSQGGPRSGILQGERIRRPPLERDGRELQLAKGGLARIIHESPAATTDMAVLPGVLGCRSLRRTVRVRLGPNTLWLPGCTPIFAGSRRQFMNYPG